MMTIARTIRPNSYEICTYNQSVTYTLLLDIQAIARLMYHILDKENQVNSKCLPFVISAISTDKDIKEQSLFFPYE